MNKIPLPLIKLLADGEYHSGEAIGEILAVSRAAVWKQLQKLGDIGLEVESVKGKGYRLRTPLSLLNETNVQACLNTLLPGATARVLPVIDSTNDEVNRRIFKKELMHKGDLVMAELQTAGRGRRGRSWQTAFGKNLMMSMYWSFDKGIERIDGLSLVVGLALAKVLKGAGFNHVGLKWPNDVMVGDKKAAGILLEMNGDPTSDCSVVIGVGINVNMARGEVEGIDQPWVSLSEIEGQSIDRTELTEAFVAGLIGEIERFEKKGFSPLKEDWECFDWLADKSVVVKRGEVMAFGVGRGVDKNGGLLLEHDNGQLTSYTSGEVSVRRQ